MSVFFSLSLLPSLLIKAPACANVSRAVAYLRFYFGEGGGGGQNICVKVGVFAWRSHVFARGYGGMLPQEIFFKWCNLVRFGEYFAKIL